MTLDSPHVIIYIALAGHEIQVNCSHQETRQASALTIVINFVKGAQPNFYMGKIINGHVLCTCRHTMQYINSGTVAN